MKLLCVSFLLAFLSWGVCLAQAPDTLWTRTYGTAGHEEARSMEQTSDGGHILAGRSWSLVPANDNFYLVKTDSAGNPLWTVTSGGASDDVAYSVDETTDGGFIAAGYTYSFGAGGSDFYLVKIGLETPYDATVYLDSLTMNPVVRWMAPRTCNYWIYISTDMGGNLEPPGPTWSVAATLPNVPAGAALWTDPAGLVPYKRYAVTMSCP